MKITIHPNPRIILWAVIIGTCIAACKKDKPKATEKVYPSELQAGNFLPSEVEVTSWEPNDLLAWIDSTIATRTYDLTHDGVPDIEFKVSNLDTLGNLTEDGHSNATLSIKTLNPDLYILTDSCYVIPFVQGDNIRLSDHWGQGVLTLLNRTYTCCPATPHVYEGLWTNNTEGYIGIRYKNRLGWINMRIVYNCAIKTYHFAFSK